MIQLLPGFACFLPSKKDCLISLDGEHPSSLENVYRISLIININQKKLMKEDAVPWIEINNFKLEGTDNSIIELINELIPDYNIIIHTENKELLKVLIKNDLFGFANNSVGLSSNDKTKKLKDWRDFVLEIKEEEDNIVYSIDDETYTSFEEILHLIEDEKLIEIFRAKKENFKHSDFIDGEDIIENIVNRAYDEVDEFSEVYCSRLEEEKHAKNIENLVLEYLNENVEEPSFFIATKIEKVRVKDLLTNNKNLFVNYLN